MKRTVYGPDGRQWSVTRRLEGDGLLGRLRRRSRWIIEARTDGPPAETRHWYATRLAEARGLADAVAMSLRTGSEGPLQPGE